MKRHHGGKERRTRTKEEKIVMRKQADWFERRAVAAHIREVVRDAALGKLTPRDISYLRRALLEVEWAHEDGRSAPCAIDELNREWRERADREV